MGTTTVTRNFQITLPKDIREIESIKVGDTLVLTVENDEIVMKKLKGKVIEECFGSWGKGPSGLEYVKSIRLESEKRLKRMGL